MIRTLSISQKSRLHPFNRKVTYSERMDENLFFSQVSVFFHLIGKYGVLFGQMAKNISSQHDMTLHFSTAALRHARVNISLTET